MRHEPFSVRPFSLLAAGILLAASVCVPAAAQVPDTIPRDTAAVAIPPEQMAPDTLPRDRTGQDTVPPDSTLPAPNFPAYPRAGGGGWSGTWTWERQALDYYHGLSLLDLLERVPGLLVTRTGSFGSPAATAAYGLGGGRLRLFVDGWEVQPLGSATLDLQQVQMADLGSVRVERGLLETRVDVTTFRLPDRRPFAQVEAADGDFNTKILRGFFARPVGERWVVQGLFDLAETDGFARQQPAGVTTIGGRVSRSFGEGRGVQLEYRTSAFDRGGAGDATLFPEVTDRREVILRGAWRAGDLRLHGVAGRSQREQGGSDTTAFEGSGTQLGVTAEYALPFGTLAGEARTFRGDGGFAPDATELSARAAVTLSPRVGLVGEVRSLTRGGVGGIEAEAAARLSPLAGVSLFGSFATGTRGIVFAQDSAFQRRTFGGLGRPVGVDTLQTDSTVAFRVLESTGTGFRAGAEWAPRERALLGAALVRTDVDRLAPFALAWDIGLDPVDAGPVTAVEAYASTPLFRDWLRVDGWYARTTDTGGRPYLPEDFGRVALEYHDVFFTGNLEPTLRLEAIVRGPAATLASDGVSFGGTTERYALFNVYLQVRILDVRAFIIAENLLNRRTPFDVSGFTLPGYRAMYGVRWFFRN